MSADRRNPEPLTIFEAAAQFESALWGLLAELFVWWPRLLEWTAAREVSALTDAVHRRGELVGLREAQSDYFLGKGGDDGER